MRPKLSILATIAALGLSTLLASCAGPASAPTPTPSPLPTPSADLFKEGLRQFARVIIGYNREVDQLQEEMQRLEEVYTPAGREEALEKLGLLSQRLDDVLRRYATQGFPEISPGIRVTSTVAVYYSYLRVYRAEREAMTELGKAIAGGDAAGLARARELEQAALRFAREADGVFVDYLRDYNVTLE